MLNKNSNLFKINKAFLFSKIEPCAKKQKKNDDNYAYADDSVTSKSKV